jgi:hypothetical protein
LSASSLGRIEPRKLQLDRRLGATQCLLNCAVPRGAVPKHEECTSDWVRNVDFDMGLELGLMSLKVDQRLRAVEIRGSEGGSDK